MLCNISSQLICTNYHNYAKDLAKILTINVINDSIVLEMKIRLLEVQLIIKKIDI
uniref:Uncharacterized protein n=1 Tax=viral metagenome TaxID=1070528 RepID=A0A6C0CBQ6_9ZZZZ